MMDRFKRLGGRGGLRERGLFLLLFLILFLTGATPATSSDSYYAARRLVAATQSAYDADAQDYFDRAEALSAGCFDLTAISGTYTESYVKGAINTWVVTCKADGTWDKLTEVYLLVGVQFGAITAKLKYDTVATLTNNGFVSGDYLAAGSGAGLTGDGSSYLDTSYVSTLIGGMSIYVTAPHSSSCPIGSSDLYSSIRSFIDTFGTYRGFLGDAVKIADASSGAASFIVATRRAANDAELYQNGVSQGASSTTVSAVTGTTNFVFARRLGLTASMFSQSRMNFVCFDSGLSSTDAANLTSAVNTLMTALGCNVY